MNFNTLAFLLFLPAVFLLHWALPHRFRWAMLLGASLLFYFWWEPLAGLLLCAVILATWLCGLGAARDRPPAMRRASLLLALASCLGCLAVFKYAGFFASLAGGRLTWKLLLPVGISFYTFQSLSYVLDVYRGRFGPERHIGYYALFISFFPQLVAGPIERADRLLPQLRRERRLSREGLSEGAWLLLSGYFKKTAVADGLAPLVDAVYAAPGEAAGPEIVLATALFGLQIYCDFSGYSDIARGAAKLLGVEMTENFRRPYAARSIRDFWRRWHVSLTAWFTDYVYIPLGGSRKGLPRQCVNIMVVFLLSGLWHGADWSFVVWGGIHGLYQVCGLLMRRGLPRRPEGRGLGLLRCGRTFALAAFAWLFFRAGSMADACVLLARLGTGWSLAGGWPHLQAHCLPFILTALACLYFLERLPAPADMRGGPGAKALAAGTLLLAVGLGWWAGLAGGGGNAFIYFQF